MIAIDTNVILYSVDRQDLRKRAAARALLKQVAVPPGQAVLLWQVAGESARQLRAWRDAKRISDRAFKRYLPLFRRLFPLTMPTPAVLDRAIVLADGHSLSHWDSMIVAACIEAGIDRLYTEDMGSPRQIETVQLLNPF
jgi:predicted nucleic acid-binding protein